MEKELGKIKSVKFGIGGYQDAMLGIFFSFEFDGSGVCADMCGWDANLIKCTKHCKWTESDRSDGYDKTMRFISDLLRDAKVKDVNDLAGKPVEVCLEGNTLKSWRLLTEVI